MRSAPPHRCSYESRAIRPEFPKAGLLGERFPHELDVLRGFRGKRLDTGMRSFKREPTFKSAALDDREGLGPVDRHHSLGDWTSGMLFQQVPLLHQDSRFAVFEVHLADAGAQAF